MQNRQLVHEPPKSEAQNDDVAIAPNPPVVRISNKPVDMSVIWPCNGKATYLDGKIKGVMITPRVGELERAIAGGNVVYAGSYRGYGQAKRSAVSASIQNMASQLRIFSFSVTIGLSIPLA